MRITKKMIGMILVIAVLIISLPFMDTKVSKAETDYGLENPKVQYMTRDIVEFGHYWQEDTNGDGKANQNDKKTPIRWQVLERNGNELFLLADKILDRKAYNDEYTSITWENCTLRSWLNSDFYNNAFSSAEKASIKESNISNLDNPKYGTEGGNDTKDRVFLMSIEEMTSYGFNEDYEYDDQARMGKVTAYAKNKGLSAGADGTGWWWLRSPGDITDGAAGVSLDGSVHDGGSSVKHGGGVRPALHINLSSTTIQPTESEKTLTISSVKCKKNTKKITGKLSVSGAVVKIKVGKKTAKKAAVKGRKFTLKLSYRLKKKTKVTITVTKKDYTTLKKVYVVK